MMGSQCVLGPEESPMELKHGEQMELEAKLEPDHGHLKYFLKEFGFSSINNEVFDTGSDCHAMTDVLGDTLVACG